MPIWICKFSVDELPDFDEELGVLASIEEDENVEVEIELKEEEPAFLKGYGRQSLQVGHVELPVIACVKCCISSSFAYYIIACPP